MLPFLTLALSAPLSSLSPTVTPIAPESLDAVLVQALPDPPSDAPDPTLAQAASDLDAPSASPDAPTPQVPFEPIAPTPPVPATPKEVFRPQEVRPLPNTLDEVPVFNSNSPELVIEPGILLSTFPPSGMAAPRAHLDYTFNGRFDIFAHHIAKSDSEETLRTVYLGILAHNPSDRPVIVDFLEGATYLSQPDAPFVELPSHVPNPHRLVYAGPGSRVTDEVLRDHLQARLPLRQVIRPGQSEMLLNVPILFRGSPSLVNGRSTYIRLRSNGDIHLASMAMFAPFNAQGFEDRPTLAAWENMLRTGTLAGPRDIAASPPDTIGSPFYYGRVSGVAQGSEWVATLTDPGQETLSIPAANRPISYGLSLLDRGTLGTGQIQSAPMLRRYPDTSYRAHGNYGIEYRLTLPLVNNTRFSRTVAIALETPIKDDRAAQAGGLRFFEPRSDRVFFRGTVEVSYTDDRGVPQTDYYHLVQHRGQQGEPLVTLNLRPGEQRNVRVSFLYPPDATPPQVLTVKTLR
ncbi:MAG: DUF3370 domain-containing protein [Spirulinaceae cyanobacterium]